MTQGQGITPYGYCECQCGERTNIATRTQTRKGWVKGEPLRYIAGHRERALRRPLEERFWEKVARRAEDECWQWTGARNRDGYGYLWNDGQMPRANRLVWELTNGPIPAGMEVCHSCDNPPCVNPAHLWLGTTGDNARDRETKRRGRWTKHWKD